MPRRLSLYCHRCHRDQLFVHSRQAHGPFSGGHEDWHCSVCGGCAYSLAKPVRLTVPVTAQQRRNAPGRS